MNSKHRISVILSVYNGQRYLEAAIRSIIGQTFTNFEFIIINDCSDDQTLKIINKFGECDNRITLINNEARLGLTISLNKGIKLAKGDYIARMDADDICQANRFEQQLAYLDAHSEVFLCATEFDYIDAKNNVIKRNVVAALTSDQIETKLGRKNCLLHPTIMFRNDGSRFRDKFYYSQDYDFYLTALTQKKRFALLPSKFVLYRWDPAAISYRNRSKQNAFAKKALRFYRQRRAHNHDDYDAFDPNTILSLPDDVNNDERLLADLITFYLQNNQSEMAWKVFQSYRRIDNKSQRRQSMLFLFVTFPPLYRLYRRFRYGHDTAN